MLIEYVGMELGRPDLSVLRPSSPLSLMIKSVGVTHYPQIAGE